MAVVVFGIVSCSKSMSQYNEEIDRAEKLMQSSVDSALSVLDAIEPSELKIDSLRAKYHFLKRVCPLGRQPFYDRRFSRKICV